MGYELTLKIKKEDLKPEFIPQCLSFNEDDIERQKNIIIAICLLKKDSDGVFSFTSIEKTLDINVKMLISYIEETWKNNLKKTLSDDGEFYICGREYSCDSDGDYEWLLIRAKQKLFIIDAVVDTPDFFEDENKFWEKEDKIRELLDSIEEVVNDKWTHKFVDTYRNNDEICETDESY